MKGRRFAMITVGIFIVILMALEIFLCVWFFGAKYPEFDGLSRVERAIGGLEEGFVPQGLGVTAEGDLLVSGYMAEGEPSRLYLLGEKGKYVTVKSGEKTLTSHFGGVTASGDNVYLTDGSKILRFSLREIAAAEQGGAVEPKGSYPTSLSNAFCFVEGDTLYAGEFYREGNYETDPSHHKEANGEVNPAFVYAYSLDAEGDLSVAPIYGYSVRGLVQGFAKAEGKVYLSCSYGLPDSELFVYDDPVGGEPAFTENGIPMYRLDGTNLKNTLTMPSMSEGLCVKEDRLFVLFESDCTKYRHFVRRTIDEVVSLPLSLEK